MKCTLMRLESVREKDFYLLSLLTDAHCHQMGTFVVIGKLVWEPELRLWGRSGW